MPSPATAPKTRPLLTLGIVVILTGVGAGFLAYGYSQDTLLSQLAVSVPGWRRCITCRWVARSSSSKC